MRLAFRIALRFLTSSKGQTVLISLGIAIGISVQIFIGSLIDGLQISLLDATIGKASHITVLPENKNEPIENIQAIGRWVAENTPEVTAMTPTLTRVGFVEVDGNLEQILMRGFDLEAADGIYAFNDILVSGALPQKEGDVLIGIDLSKENNIALGDTISIVTPQRTSGAYNVTGFIDLKVASINKTWVVASLEDTQALYGFNSNEGTAIELQITEPFEADAIAEGLTQSAPYDAVIFDNWKAQNEQLLSGLSGQSTSSLMIQVFVVISVVLGIASVLAITVLQKSRQLGILKAMGINDLTSSLVFLFQGFILGIIGGLLGIALGLGLLWSFSKFALNADGTPVVPIYFNLRFIALSGGIAVLASTLASVIPALKSKNLSPMEVIKNG